MNGDNCNLAHISIQNHAHQKDLVGAGQRDLKYRLLHLSIDGLDLTRLILGEQVEFDSKSSSRSYL